MDGEVALSGANDGALSEEEEDAMERWLDDIEITEDRKRRSPVEKEPIVVIDEDDEAAEDSVLDAEDYEEDLKFVEQELYASGDEDSEDDIR
ncbi:unnamed protein product, partial [Symbiodinium microadriaticum]